MKGTAYLVQSALISIWWVALALSDTFFEAFQFPGIPKVAFYSFLLPDVVLVAVLSVIRAYVPKRSLEFLILGAFAYACLYCINASLLTSGGYLSTTLMLLGLLYNVFLVFQFRVFKTSNTVGFLGNALKTLLQIVSVWSITLVLFPYIIMDAFHIEVTSSDVQRIVALFGFVISSLLGLSSAYVLVAFGNGTPLPADQTNDLVVSGPYRWIRNPMALAGMGQGLSIALYVGSLHLAIYTILGGLIWHFAVRPIEERNMVSRFGEAYRTYRDQVGLWIPKRGHR
ncbi:isoprenylcysteine carboxylmethyltransferase family protein [Flagellimonas sp. DF-77]|uniref:methyltransferase family protein n=1 Tax=Flagellimonas algarum TaxID=3230298 RepID=UPI00339AB3E7